MDIHRRSAHVLCRATELKRKRFKGYRPGSYRQAQGSALGFGTAWAGAALVTYQAQRHVERGCAIITAYP